MRGVFSWTAEMRFVQEHIEIDVSEGTIFLSQDQANAKATVYLSPDQIDAVAKALIAAKDYVTKREASHDSLPEA